jgi:hypothetical protein
MYQSVLKMKFDSEIKKILEGFNVYPRAKVPMDSKNMNFTGPMPTGFKGAGMAGVGPGQQSTVIIKWPKKKKKKRFKKKKGSSS